MIARRIAASLVLTLSFGSQATAEDWRYSVAPYLWGAGLSGEAATLPGAPPADVDLAFSDILDNLDFAGMIAGNARKGDFGIVADLQYVDLVSEGDLPGPAFRDVELASSTTIISLLGEYRVASTETAEIWVAAGARYWKVDTDLKLSGGAAGDARTRYDDSWVDPVIGLRGSARIDGPWSVNGWAYIGGFGAGSDFMSDLFAGVGYDFTPNATVVLGYRHITVDREDGDFLWDVTQQGPMLGGIFRF